MKCPQCGINYDDGDKECPMCGARRPLFAKSTDAPAARSTAQAARSSTTSGQRGSMPTGEDWTATEYKTTTCAHPKPRDCSHNTPQRSVPPKTAPTAQKTDKKRNPLVVLIVIIILLNMLPSLLGAVFLAFEELTDALGGLSSRSGVTIDVDVDRLFNDMDEAESDAPPAKPVESFPYASAFEGARGTLTLNEDKTYTVTANGLRESGSIFWWECETEDDYFDPDIFPFDQYSCIALSLEPTAVERDTLLVPDTYPADDQARYLSLYIDRDTGEMWAVDDFDELFWFGETEQQV